uniref:MucR family transcriptional regulator n=1 Tax=Castellaniella defragrans TaxID=75697 RepID=UPI003340D940
MPPDALRTISSLADVRAYTSGDRVVCLICGQAFKSVGRHVHHAHGISAREYKIRFGLPIGRGLDAADVREAQSKRVQKTRAAGRLPQSPPPEPPRPGESPKKPGYFHADMRRISSDEVRRIMQWIESGDTIAEACARPGMPKWTAVHTALDRDAGLRREFYDFVERLPFSQQARMKKLGARFDAAIAKLSGMTNAEIASRLGVSEEAVRRRRKRIGL